MKARFLDSATTPDVHGPAPPTHASPEAVPEETERRLRAAAAILARGAIRAALSQKSGTAQSETPALGPPEAAQDNSAQ